MQITATTTAAPLPLSGHQTPVIQNLGPDPVYLGGSEVTIGNGLQLATDAAYEFPSDLNLGFGNVWAVSAGVSDLRILVVG